MNHKERVITIAILTVVTAIVVGWVQLYRFYGITADNQFLMDGDWLTGQLSKAGGVAMVMSSAITQFFIYPIVGVVASTLIYSVMAWLLIALIDREGEGRHIYGLVLLPIVFLILCIENSYYSFHGHVALLMAVGAVWAWDKCVAGKPVLVEAIVGILAGVLLYWMAGSVAIVFAAMTIVGGIVAKRVPVGGLTSVVGIGIMAYWSVETSDYVSMKEALTPLMYYNWPSSFFFQVYAWASLPLMIAIDAVVRALVKAEKRRVYGAVIVAIVVVGMGANMYRLIHNEKTYVLRHEGYLAAHEEWDAIVAMHKGDRQPVFFISYLNLALAKKGELLQEMNRYNQMDIREKLGWHPSSTDGLQVMSDIYYHMGYLSAARKAAFDQNVLTPGAVNPRELMKLAAINKAMGQAKVAEKYMGMARKAPLYSDKEIEEMNVAMPLNDRFLEVDGLIEDLKDIADANKGNEVARQFYEAYKIMFDKMMR